MPREKIIWTNIRNSMKISSKHAAVKLATFSFIALFTGLTCCTKVDDKLGLDLVPGDQIMSVHIDTFGIEGMQRIRTYTQLEDSVVTSLLGYSILGSYTSSTFGKTRAASILQMMPVTESTIKKGGYGFAVSGNRPDSVLLSLKPTLMDGDYEKEQTFVIYTLTDTLAIDSTYYKSFDYERIKDKEPILSFTLSGKFDSTHVVKAEITEKGNAYMKELLSDSTYYYGNRPKFHQKFKGIVIEPAENSPEDAAIYSLNLETAYFYLYFTNPERAKDTLFVPLYFRDNLNDEDVLDSEKNMSITAITTDYTGTPVEEALALTKEMIPQPVTYVHGFGGVTTKLEFPDEFYEAIISKKGEGDLLFFNQALIYIDLLDHSWQVMDESHARLGSYYYYVGAKGIPDYSLTDQSSSSATSYYNGYLSRTHGYYMMDITTFLHNAVKEYQKKKDGKDYRQENMQYTLAPTYDMTVQKGETVLRGFGSESQHIWLELTYTIIE